MIGISGAIISRIIAIMSSPRCIIPWGAVPARGRGCRAWLVSCAASGAAMRHRAAVIRGSDFMVSSREKCVVFRSLIPLCEDPGMPGKETTIPRMPCATRLRWEPSEDLTRLEARGRLPRDGPGAQDVDVLEIELADAEIFVADVAAAQNRGDPVGDELFVVHAAI